MLSEDDPCSEEIIKELCVCNRVSYERIVREGPATKSLEMFFSGYPKMVGLSYFPNLINLTLIGQTIESITGLESCLLLQELWITECQLTQIQGLQECLNMKRLFLYSNNISVIESLENLTNLEVLWLNDNQIEEIEGLETLQNLKELNLAGNLIHSIGHSLDPNVSLERLNLSGNKISSFKELTNLARLDSLRDLGLKDPQYTPNPVCLFCNYATHVLYHMPQLQRLDTCHISQKQIKDLAESTVMKKIMYYNMRVKTIQRQLREELEKLREEKCRLEQLPQERIKILLFQVKRLDLDMSDLQSLQSHQNISSCPEYMNSQGGLDNSDSWLKEESNRSLELVEKISQKLCALKERIQFWTSKTMEIDFFHEKEIANTTESFDLLIQFLQTELETVGNIRFEEGTLSDSWFKSCYELILSRFCALNVKTFGISGVKINRIVRVHNRNLRSKFEDRVQDYLDSEDGTASESYKKMLEYLFYIFDPKCETQDLLQILEDGFRKPYKVNEQNQGDFILLSNSLGFSEIYKPEQATTLGKNSHDLERFKPGKLIIVKVFLGRSVQAKENLPVDPDNYPNANSVFRTLKFKGNSIYSSDDDVCASEEHGNCECSLHRCQWFMFDPKLILPEYIVDFQYIPQHKPTWPSALSSYDSEWVSAAVEQDEAIISMDPVLKSRPKIISLDESTILSVAKVNAYSQVTILNLHGNSLSKLKEISKLHRLRKLVISFNEFTNLEDVSCLMNLEYLDASHNHVMSLEGFKGLPKLEHLDLTWNQLTRTREDMSILRKHTPHLLSLQIAHNPWQKSALVRMVAIARIKSLTHLDGVQVTDEEVLESLKFFSEGRITQASLLANGRTDCVKPRCLSLLPSAQILSQISKNYVDPYAKLNDSWYHLMTSINFDGQGLSKITSLEKLENLRWASFSNNYLTKIEGLDHCVKLEELCLDGNCITKLEGLSNLVKLQHLSINDNHLISLDKEVIDHLSQLHFFSAENNKITSLSGLQKAQTLIELYLSNNQISNNQEIYYLKGIGSLVILDLCRNPISLKNENYRLFVIFHLSLLKALDGSAVDQLESENAKDVFGGRLSSDIIAEKLGHQNFTELKELNWRSSSIRSVDLLPADQFRGIHTVNLENNNLTSFSGLIFLSHVKSLYLSYNHIESILPRQKCQNHLTNRQILHQKVNSSGYGQQGKTNRDTLFGETLSPIMLSLEVLDLGYNGISNLHQLQLSRLRNLKSLFLQGNQISQVEGLDGLEFLQELVLNHNRIKVITETSFAKQSSLSSLHLEENRLRDVNNLLSLIKLKKLFIGNNKIQEISEVEKLEVIPTLLELSVSGNSISKKLYHRQLLILRLQNLQILDGIVVTHEERARAEIHFMEQQSLVGPNPVMELVNPLSTVILTKPPPLRVTNVGLPASFHHFAGPDLHLNNGQDDFLSNDFNKYKKSKNNPRNVNADIAFKQLRATTNISASYLAQQTGQNRVANTQASNPEQEGRSLEKGSLRQNRM